MSQLMHMRQRIQAVQTIKKITHAMRLISMSTHSRMKHQEQPLTIYQNTIRDLMQKIGKISKNCSNELLFPTDKQNEHALVILVGSQKGLCGNFNTMLMQQFNLYAKKHPAFSLITVGKRATQLAMPKYRAHIIAEYDTFGLHNLLPVAQKILAHITAQTKYGSVRIISNTAPSFFTQKPHIHQIIPAKHDDTSPMHEIDYDIEQPAQAICDKLTELYLLSHIQYALFQSLLAEHASRFISMDSSTRNADTMLEQLRLDYNKLRQANITRELTELSAFFLQ